MSAAAGRPPLYGDLRRWALVQADALALLAELPDASVDAVITDPPYGLAFNGQAWDGGVLRDGLGFQAFSRSWAEQAGRVLRPGGHLVSFGATRTIHRAIAGIEDAGLQIRDQLVWLHGQGTPKRGSFGAGLGAALKPAHEPIVLARRPLDSAGPTITANVALHGTGALNIDATRLVAERYRDPATGRLVARWPANVVLGHQPNCSAEGCETGCTVAAIDQADPLVRPSRFFYCAKAPRLEREAGLERLPHQRAEIFSGSGRTPRANVHPTVKPLELMRWLVRLVVPPGGLVIDPFTGSGSSGIAAVLEDRQFLGIERDAHYTAIARARIAHWASGAEREHGR